MTQRMHNKKDNNMTDANSLSVSDQSLNGLFIPPCPATLTSVMNEARKPAADLEKVAHLIGQDAGLVAPLLKLVNSPFIGLRSKVTSIFQAISVLGLQNTLNLVQNIALRQSMNGGGESFEKFWERSSLTASIAERMAKRFPNISKDDAYITALFHDCGIPVLIMKYPDYRAAMKKGGEAGMKICEIEEQAFSTNHAVVGNMLTRTWALPAHVCKAILFHHDPTIFSSPSERAPAEVCNLIGLVHMAECVADEHLLVRDKEWQYFAKDVLKYFELSEQEFTEFKGDILAYLNGE